jgi:hypothetical protein
MKGYVIGILEILLYFIGSMTLLNLCSSLKTINKPTYFWVMMTILTGVWEIAYISNYMNVTKMSEELIQTNTHTWTNNYDISYVLPWKLSYIFYAEYGAWADREYMSHTDDWSRIIEGSHCTQCALFSFIAITFKIIGYHNNYLIALSVAMGTQFMNSYLYMFSYFIQETEPTNVNYSNSSFPSDTWLTKRPFMWVNIFWLVMPFYTILYYILENCSKYKQNNLNQIKQTVKENLQKKGYYWTDNYKITKM